MNKMALVLQSNQLAKINSRPPAVEHYRPQRVVRSEVYLPLLHGLFEYSILIGQLSHFYGLLFMYIRKLLWIKSSAEAIISVNHQVTINDLWFRMLPHCL